MEYFKFIKKGKEVTIKIEAGDDFLPCGSKS